MSYGFRDTPELTRMLKEIAREIAEADGIVPLKPGETRSSDYYSFNHYTARGLKPLWASKPAKKMK